MNARFKFLVVSSSTILVVLLLFGAVIGRSASPEDAYRPLSVYTEVLSRIKSEYVEEPDIKSVTLGAINGMLESIDPYASYLNPDQYKQYQKSLDSKRPGVGLILSKKFGYVGVVDSLPGSAAARAGLTTGDMIEAINGIATRDMPLAYAELLLQGEANTPVEISVLRLRNPEPQKISLTRAPVKYSAVLSKMLPEQVGLIQVAALDAGKLKDVENAVKQVEKQGAKRLILDLRNNAVGKPEDGIALADLFMDSGQIGTLEGQRISRQAYNASPGNTITHLPLVVLTNRGTGSAVEIAAAALLDSKRAEVVGERSYGDAAVRRAVTLEDGSAVILSVGKFHSPSGKAIQDTGVTPGVLIADTAFSGAEEDDETGAPGPADPEKPKEDAILKRAIEIAVNGKTESAKNGAEAPPKSEPKPEMPPTQVKPDRQ